MNPAPEENAAPPLGTDPIRLFYLLMLDLLEPRTVAAFWANRGIRTCGGTVRGAALLDHLLGIHDDIPIDDVSRLIDDIECLLDEHGLGDERFLDDALAQAAGRGELVSPRMATYILGSMAESLLAADDGREAILDARGQPRFNDLAVLDSGAGTPSYADIGALERQAASGNHAPTVVPHPPSSTPAPRSLPTCATHPRPTPTAPPSSECV